MGSMIEINDTLQLTTEQGFPADLLSFESHCKNPVQLRDLECLFFRGSRTCESSSSIQCACTSYITSRESGCSGVGYSFKPRA
jgi:hypothetical protein